MTSRAILTDIEGTTSSIAFVKEVLFPYARFHLPDYVARHAKLAEVRRCLDEVRTVMDDPAMDDEAVIALLLRWIDEDRKITPLKTLQGMVWAAGYESGILRSHVYDDAKDQLHKWHSDGIPLFVFSSGSVAAQRLLFKNSIHGDLTPLFSGYFDTTTGPKLEERSYRKIASAMGFPPEDILFLSDSTGELSAASGAGMRTVCLDRGEAVIPEDSCHARVTSFADIRL